MGNRFRVIATSAAICFGGLVAVVDAINREAQAQIGPSGTLIPTRPVDVRARPPGEPVPCNPDSTLPANITINPNGTVSASDPDIEILGDFTVTTQDDVVTSFPQLLLGDDSVIKGNPCESTIDLIDNLPPMDPPDGVVLPDPAAIPVLELKELPAVTFLPSGATKRGPELDCARPFCGRDIIFVHGFLDEALQEAVVVSLSGLGNTAALARWPNHAAQFTVPGGYYHMWAHQRWNNFIQNKLGPAYTRAGASHGPRFLITAWASHQRLEIAAHAVLTQTAKAIQNGTGVMTISPPGGYPYSIVPATDTPQAPFCSQGCIIVSHSTGGPATAVALSIAAKPNSRSWWTPGLSLIPTYVKGHVALHPALSGSPLAALGLGVGAIGGAFCGQGAELINYLANAPIVPSGLDPCGAMQVLFSSALVDLAPPVMNLLWRPMMTYESGDPDKIVPSVIVAGAHPTIQPLAHWHQKLLPGFDDGVVPVDSQMGRLPITPGVPLSMSLTPWNVLGIPYFDRGSELSKAIGYFIDQNHEYHHVPFKHTAGANPLLAPTGMILKNATFDQVPWTSAGLPNYFSFLQSTSSHRFPREVGSGSSVTPATRPADNCAPGSYNYKTTSDVWAAADVYEESRAVFDLTVYTNRGRPTFNAAESVIGLVPILSPRLKVAVESQSIGRYIPIRIKPLHIDKKIWIWKRQYLRMLDWRCRDEIDYVFDFAFRQ